MADGILGDDGGALAQDELVDAVVDLGVHVVGAAGQHDDALALAARRGDDLLAFLAHQRHMAGILRIGGVDGRLVQMLGHRGEILPPDTREALGEILAALDI